MIGGGGSIRKVGPGKYIVRCSKPTSKNNPARISVSAEMAGEKKSMGSSEFRVKVVPDPVAKVAGKRGGRIKKNVLMAQTGPYAEMENFDFDLKFNVIEFTVSATINGFVSDASTRGTRFSGQQKGIIKRVGRGQKIYIEGIRAVGPDGRPRNLGTISFILQ